MSDSNGAPVRDYAHFDESRNPPVSSPLDALIRKFSAAAHWLVVLVIYAIASTAFAIALLPVLWMVRTAWLWGATHPGAWRYGAVALSLGAGFFAFALTLPLVVALYNRLLPTRIGPFKGGYYTIATVPWFLHNALFYLVRFTVLPFLTLTPFSPIFMKLMGMKLGKRVYLNTEFVSDPSLITLGDDVAIGGSVHLFAHYGGGGNLVIAPTIIERGATIGQKATVMGDVIVGAGALILPHSVLLPGARVGAGEVWGGVPAQPLNAEQFAAMKDIIRGKKK